MLPYDDCEPYVQHLLTEHRRLHTMLRLARAAIRHSAGPDGHNTTPETVRILRHEQNPDVLDALAKLTGQNFGYDEATWKAWWRRRQAAVQAD